ncbi:MAG TPA: ATP-binding protein [Thermomicrobiales bacterium]|nr:ATP-binding protein [Thermomicrobiales bacterium]
MAGETRLAVRGQADVERARREARALAGALGFPTVATEELVLAVSELATNLVRHARDGALTLRALSSLAGVEVESRDAGPGIADVAAALRDGYSTAGGLGGGLGGVRRLMDDFEVATGPAGTRIVARKWPTRPS